MSATQNEQPVAGRREWLTPGVQGIGVASLLADLQHDTARVFVTDGPIRRVTFSADGKRLAAAGTSVRVWAVDGEPAGRSPTTAVTTAVVRDDGEIATP